MMPRSSAARVSSAPRARWRAGGTVGRGMVLGGAATGAGAGAVTVMAALLTCVRAGEARRWGLPGCYGLAQVDLMTKFAPFLAATVDEPT